jgi:phosphatidylinositol alpha-mannosyltransferase
VKVAVVCPYAFDAPGGVQDQAARLVRWLRDSGHEAWAVAPGSGGPEGTRHVGAYRSIRANRSVAPIAVDPRVIRRVGAAVDDADVVHVHEPFMPMVSLGAVFADTPPIVATFHADPGAFARRAYRFAGPVLSFVTSRVAVFTAVSQVAASALGGRDLGIRVIPNGIDLDDFEGPEPRDPRRVLFLGRDEPRKGLDVLLQAWPLVRARVPGAVLRVAGAARQRGPEGTEFLGRVADEEKRAELRAAAVLVAPNLGGESFGIVVVEGMASGCAVVASDIPAFRAVGGDAVQYVSREDPPALADAVAGLLGDPDRAATLGAAARTRSRLFGRDTVLAAYLAAYHDAASGTRSGRR